MKNKDKYDLRDISYVIKSNNGKYEFVVYYNFIEIHREIFYGFVSTHDTFTKWLEEEYKPNILEEKGKEYLAAVIKPFRKNIKYITKYTFSTEAEYVKIYLNCNDYIVFPNFKRGTMYKGMKTNKEYTLEELGL